MRTKVLIGAVVATGVAVVVAVYFQSGAIIRRFYEMNPPDGVTDGPGSGE